MLYGLPPPQKQGLFLLAMGAAALLVAGVVAAAEDPLHLPIGDPARKEREAPLVLDTITDTATGTALTPAELPAHMAGVRILLVGESHTGMDWHRIERRVIEELARSGRRVLIGLEMYPYTAQAPLDLWVAGKLSEKEFLEQSRWYENWGYNWGYYRDIFLLAGQLQLPMFAINTPRDVISAVRKKGFSGLTEEEKTHIPASIDTENPEHFRLFQASIGDAAAHGAMSEQDWKAMFAAQCTWDATFAQNAIAAIRKFDNDPKAILVVLVGAGHVEYGLGIGRQAARSFSGRISTLIPVAVRDEEGNRVRTVRASYADFLWGVPAEKDPVFPSLGVSSSFAAAGTPGGYTVIHVEKKSVAESAGVLVGDVIVSMDGMSITGRESLNRVMAEKRWGDSARLSVRRGDRVLDLTAYFRRDEVEEPR